MYYVTTTDKAMSGWGPARGKINKLVFACETYQEAEVVADNADNRGDQSFVRILSRMPYYNRSRYVVQVKTRADYPKWYEKGYFKKG